MFDDLPVSRFKGYHFTLEEKLQILQAYDACAEYGAKSALVRRVGVSPSRIQDWLQGRAAGTLRGLQEGPARGDHRRMRAEERHELERLRRENEDLRARLEKSEAAVDILGKASALLEAMAKGAAQEPLPPRTPPLKRPDADGSEASS